MIILNEEIQIKDACINFLQKHFDKKVVDMSKRLRLVSDLFKFRIEDPYFFDQKKGKIPRHYSLYFDNEFVCSFDSTYPPQALEVMALRGLLKLYEDGKIQFNERLRDAQEEIEKYKIKMEKEAKKKKIKKTIEAIKSVNEESEMAAQVIDSLEKDAIA